MARVKQSQIIDGLIQSIDSVTKNRCSLSDERLISLNDAKAILQEMKKSKGKTNKVILEQAAEVVKLLSEYLLNE